MKLASYMANGRAAFGAVKDGGVVTMSDRIAADRHGGRATTLKQALAARLIPEMADIAAKTRPDHKLADITFLPVIPDPELIACAGVNYRSHATETGRDIPKQPSIFIRRPNTLVGH